MEYLDGFILELRKQKHSTEHPEDGMYIKGEKIMFAAIQLFDGKMELLLPDSFVDLPGKLAKIKYPSEYRPQIIKTNLLGDVNFAFNLFPQQVSSDQLSIAARTFAKMIKQMNPSTVFYDKATEDLGDTKLSWFDFKGYAMDGQLYYIYYVTSIGGNLLHGIFNCRMEDMQEYKEPAFLAIRSIRDLTEE